MAGAQASADYALNIAVVHEDSLPREWSTHVPRRAAQLVGPRAVHTRCFMISEFRDPAVLKEAVAVTAESDIVVVSVQAARNLPVNLHLWIDAWLPQRPRRAGALVALVGVGADSSELASCTRGYLEDVAALGHLTFLPQEQPAPAGGLG